MNYRATILLALATFLQGTLAYTVAGAEETSGTIHEHEGLSDREESFEVGEEPDSADEEDGADAYRGMEEIRVTAQGGTRNLQDVGASIAAFDADYIEALGAQTIADISQFTPNLEIRTVFAASNPTLFIRGVGLRDFNANSSSAVAVYNDDIYMNSPAAQLVQLFDVQQVEVLRGPQGTLYGRNASAGAIRIISRKPSGDTNGYSRLTYGKYNEVEAEAAIELPVSSEVSVRVSGRLRKRDGYTRNRCADPRYWRNDDTGNPATVQNIVQRYCFNTSTTQQDSYLPSSVQDNTLGPNEVNPFTGNRLRPYYFETGENEEPIRVDWYYDRELVDGVPIPGAQLSPTYYDCYTSGCSYASPLPDGAHPFLLPAFYYSQQWSAAVGPQDIDLWANAADNWAVRALVRWQPNESVDWILNAHGGMNRGDSMQFQHIGAYQGLLDIKPNTTLYRDIDNAGAGYYDADLLAGDSFQIGEIPARTPEGGDPYAGDYNRVGTEFLDLYGASLSGSYSFEDDRLLFRTITGFEGNRRSVQVNSDANPFPSGFEPTYRNDSWQLTQEFKINWDGDDGFSLEAGTNYLYEKLNTSNDWPINPIVNFATQQYEIQTQYASAYLWLEWKPVEDFALSAGGRWNYENKSIDLQTARWQRTLFGRFIQPPSDTASSSESLSANGPSGDITFTYMPTDSRLFFLKYSRGYKGPHINGGVINADQKSQDFDDLTTPVKPEKVDALEFGLKTSWLDNQLTLNGSIFYYDYQNIQIFQVRNAALGAPIQQLVNADDADIYGAEVEVRTHPLYGRAPASFDGLEIYASIGWLHARYTEFLNRLTGFDQEGIEIIRIEDNSGNSLVNAPEFAFAGYLSWPFTGQLGTLVPRVDWSYKDKVYFGAENIDELSQDPFWLVNFRLSYANPQQNIEISGWVRNLTNQAYRVDAINQARSRRSIIYVMGEPRTYGVTLNVKF